MKNLVLLFAFVSFVSSVSWSVQGLPPSFQRINRFELRKEGEPTDKQRVWFLDEHISTGQHPTVFLHISALNRLFWIERSEKDACGTTHFKGRGFPLSGESQKSKGADPNKGETVELDISCWPIPFERCGALTRDPIKWVGAYLFHELTQLGSECWVQLSLPGLKSLMLQVLLPSTLPKD